MWPEQPGIARKARRAQKRLQAALPDGHHAKAPAPDTKRGLHGDAGAEDTGEGVLPNHSGVEAAQQLQDHTLASALVDQCDKYLAGQSDLFTSDNQASTSVPTDAECDTATLGSLAGSCLTLDAGVAQCAQAHGHCHCTRHVPAVRHCLAGCYGRLEAVLCADAGVAHDPAAPATLDHVHATLATLAAAAAGATATPQMFCVDSAVAARIYSTVGGTPSTSTKPADTGAGTTAGGVPGQAPAEAALDGGARPSHYLRFSTLNRPVVRMVHGYTASAPLALPGWLAVTLQDVLHDDRNPAGVFVLNVSCAQPLVACPWPLAAGVAKDRSFTSRSCTSRFGTLMFL